MAGHISSKTINSARTRFLPPTTELRHHSSSTRGICMAKIDIRRKHGSSLKAAKAAVEKTAKAIGKKFAISSEWEGDTLHFQRSGVDGHIAVTKSEVHVYAELG